MTEKTKKQKNVFKAPEAQDVEFGDSNQKTIGHMRLKPNRILWANKNEKGWRGVSLEAFIEFMNEKGKKQTR